MCFIRRKNCHTFEKSFDNSWYPDLVAPRLLLKVRKVLNFIEAECVTDYEC